MHCHIPTRLSLAASEQDSRSGNSIAMGKKKKPDVICTNNARKCLLPCAGPKQAIALEQHRTDVPGPELPKCVVAPSLKPKTKKGVLRLSRKHDASGEPDKDFLPLVR